MRIGATLRWRPIVAVTLVTAVAYVGWAGWYAAGSERQLTGLANVGTVFLANGDGSAAIERLQAQPGDPGGYDGQFFLYIALDPLGARDYVDQEAYRYSRIFYPALARASALGTERGVPAALLIVNLLAVIAAAAALARFLQRRNVSPWFALVFSLYPGLFLAVTRDLSEPLAYSLVAVALLAFDLGGRRGLVVGTTLLALAGITRETTLLFALAVAWGLLRGEFSTPAPRARTAAVVVAAAFLPFVALKIGLAVWLGSLGTGEQTRLSLVPLGGFLEEWPPGLRSFEQFYAVVAPTFGFLLVAAISIRRASTALVAYSLNALVLVVMLPAASYVEYAASGRIIAGVVLAAVMCLPAVRLANRMDLAWMALALWLSPWYWLLPQVFGR
jgi:hypothetical protein